MEKLTKEQREETIQAIAEDIQESLENGQYDFSDIAMDGLKGASQYTDEELLEAYKEMYPEEDQNGSL